ARGGSRSSPASTAPTTSSSTPSACRRRSPPAQALPAAPPGLLPEPVDLLALPLQMLRAVEQIEDAVAAAEREPREREVEARIRLGERAGSLELRDCLLEQRQRAGVVACLHLCEARIVQLAAARRCRRCR